MHLHRSFYVSGERKRLEMIVLGAKDIEKSYGAREVLSKISFNINKGDRIGLVGINGAGKTTLFDILTGEQSSDGGELYWMKGIRFGYLKQGMKLDPDKTLYNCCLEVFQELLDMEEEIRQLEKDMADPSKNLNTILERYQRLQDEFAERQGFSYDSQIKGMLRGLGFQPEDFDEKISTLSGGQKSRIKLAQLLLKKPDLLFLDEPTNHLDMKAISFLESFLRDYEGTCFVISHDRYFLDAVVNRIFHLENKKIEIYNTNYSDYMVERKTRLKILWDTYNNQQKERKRQEEIIEKYLSYGNARLIRQGQSRKKMLDKMSFQDRPEEESGSFDLAFSPAVESGKDVARAKDISKSYDGSEIFKEVEFTIFKGEKVGLIGDNGVGKTTLFNIMMNRVKPDTGSVVLGSQVHVGYYDQEQRSLHSDKTVVDEIWDEFPYLTHYEIRSYLAKFLFMGDDIFKLVDELSGGEKSRISLLKLMLSNTNFLLLDEPTNHLDIDSKEALENALKDYTGTCFIISHDRYFLNKVVDKIILLEHSGVTEFLGNYDYYKEKTEGQTSEEEKDLLSKTQIQKDKKRAREEKQRLKSQKKEILALEGKIEIIEEELNALQEESLTQEFYEDKERIEVVFKRIDALEKEKEELYEDWFILQEDI